LLERHVLESFQIGSQLLKPKALDKIDEMDTDPR
jgi:hypothetical protein